MNWDQLTSGRSDRADRAAQLKQLAIGFGMVLAVLASISMSILLDKNVLNPQQAERSDAHWPAAQFELAVSALEGSVRAAQAQDIRSSDPTLLDMVRRDIRRLAPALDGLVSTAEMTQARNDPRIAGLLSDLENQIADLYPYAAAQPVVLRLTLPEVRDTIMLTQATAADLSQASADWYAQQSEQRANDLQASLSRVAVMAISLVLLLLVLTAFLMRLSRQAQARASAQRDTANLLRSIVETSFDAVVVFGGNGKIRALNGSAEVMFGYDRRDALDETITELLIPTEFHEGFHAAMRSRASQASLPSTEPAARVEMRALRKSGEEFPVEYPLDYIAEANGPVFVAFLRDITESRLAESRLVEARDKALAGERAKAEFLAVMSHEMRTPLNGLLGTLSLLGDTGLDQRQRSYVDNMQASGRLLMHHVNDVLEISKYEAGKVVISNVPFALEPLLNELIEGQRSVAEGNGNALSYDWLSTPVKGILGDPVRLRQILLNLLSNAIKFTRNGSVSLEIEVLGRGPRQQIEFRVIDTGIGIAEENLDRIFGDFETLDSTYGRRVEGTGLGLGIAKRLAEAMKGEIGVDSIEGEGSMFWLRMPLTRADIVEHDEMPESTPAMQRKLRLLIVEDNQINRVVLRDMLISEGHSVVEAVNGQEGVQKSETERFDAILTDISMPVMDGVQAARAIRNGAGASADVPILAVTAHALPDEIRAFVDAGMNDVIGKPIVRVELLTKLAQYCGTMQPSDTQLPTDTDAVDTASDSVDRQRLRELVDDLGADTAQVLLARFIEEADETFAGIGQNGTQPVAELVPQLHKIAGSAAALGASALHRRLGQLEVLGKTGAEVEFREGLQELAPIWAATRQEVSAAVTRA